MAQPSTAVSVVLTLGRQIAAGAANLIAIALIASALGTAGAGQLAVALLLPNVLAQLMNFGLAPSNVYYIASGRTSIDRAWAVSRNTALVLSALGVGLGLLAILKFGSVFFPNVGSDALLIALSAFPLMLGSAMLLSLLQAKQDFLGYNRVFLVQPVVSVLLIGLLLVLDNLTLVAALWSILVSHIVATLIGLASIRPLVRLNAHSGDQLSYLRPALNYGIKMHINDNIAFFNRRLDLFLVNLFIGIEAAGLYAVAARIVEQLWVLSKAAAAVLFPKLSTFAPDDPARTIMTETMARIVLWLTALAAGVLAVISEPMLALVFGQEFVAAQIAILLLLPGAVARSVSRILAGEFASRGRAGLNLVLGVVVLVLNTALNLLLIPEHGISGAAAATTSAYLIMLVLRIVLQRHITGLRIMHSIILMPSDWRHITNLLTRLRSVKS